MTADELRVAFPDWFGEFDPSYPSWEDLYDDPDGPVVGGTQIANRMAEITGDQSWRSQGDPLNAMIGHAQVAYYWAYKDWLPRNAPMGSRWRPYERRGRNHAGQLDGTDWGSVAGKGLDREPLYAQVYAEDHMKPIADSGNRKRKDGIIEAGLGNFGQRPIGTVPFYPVFHMANTWWRANRDLHFHPDFEACTIMPKHFQAKTASAHARAWALQVIIDDLNPAARFWQLICGEVDYLLQDSDDLGPLERNQIFRIAGLVANSQYRHAAKT